jgi:hypothetical protein
MKRCTKCGVSKPESEFYAAKGGKDGLRGDCKSCFAARAREWYAKNRAKAITRASEWRNANIERARATRRARYPLVRERTRDQHLQRTFGITLEEYAALLSRQGGVCAICLQPPRPGESFHVDHHDDRGGVRGILCVRCNNALGQLRESVSIAERAVDYLESNGFARTGVYELRAVAVARARELVATPG